MAIHEVYLPQNVPTAGFLRDGDIKKILGLGHDLPEKLHINRASGVVYGYCRDCLLLVTVPKRGLVARGQMIVKGCHGLKGFNAENKKYV